MSDPTAAVLIIGDEILSGRTREGNMYYLAGKLTEKGIRLQETRIVPDDHATIVSAVNELRMSNDYLFTSGGIGPTHDDITADAVAAAFGANIDVREDARTILQAHYDRAGIEMNAARLRMARIPQGAELIENPISAAPGFRLENVFVMAGVPPIFQVMADTVLARISGGRPILSLTVQLNRPEGEVAERLGRVAEDFPDISIGSYPFMQDGILGTRIVARSPDQARLDAVRAFIDALKIG